jgi:hypothetical protein
MMRLVDFIVIYLAAGAPFAARQLMGTSGPRTVLPVLKSVANGITWPLSLLNYLSGRSDTEQTTSTAVDTVSPRCSVDVALVQLVNHLDLLSISIFFNTDPQSSAFEDVIKRVRLAAEKYAALTLAVGEMAHDDSPAPHQIELARIAGRTGDDLLIAGICAHRQCFLKLAAQRTKSRNELFDVLNKLLELVYDSANSRHRRFATASKARVAVAEFYYSIRRLFQAAGDETTADLVAASYNRSTTSKLLAPLLYRKHGVTSSGEELCMTDLDNPALHFRDSNPKVNLRVNGQM